MAIHELFAYIHVKDAEKALAFYTSVFGVAEKFRLTEPSGRIGHAELEFGGTTLMLSDEFPECGTGAPVPDKPVSVRLMSRAEPLTAPSRGSAESVMGS